VVNRVFAWGYWASALLLASILFPGSRRVNLALARAMLAMSD